MNIRTGPVLKRLLPWNWLRSSTQIDALERTYDRRLNSMLLANLPLRPSFTFCSTDLTFGVNWVFERERVGDYQVGYLRGADMQDWKVSRAVAASSCFPPVFDPCTVRLNVGKLKDGKCKDRRLLGCVRLTDGGVYDNLGLEPAWKTHRVVLVSDGGAPFKALTLESSFRVLMRYTDVVMNQVASLRKRWLISGFLTNKLAGTYWGIGGSVDSYQRSARQGLTKDTTAPSFAGYSEDLVKSVISRVRTDLDAFSAAEIAVLGNHGYSLADMAIRMHEPELMKKDAEPFRLPHPAWTDEAKVREALVDSCRTRILGRGTRAFSE
jgi:NTE family protein